MHALDLHHQPAALAALGTDLRRAHPELDRPLALPWSEQTVLALDGEVPWAYGPVERDPMARDGRIVVPRPQRRQLSRLAERGLTFRRIAIAHELRPDGPVAGLLPALRHGPRLCTDEVARAVVGPVPAPPAVRRSVHLLTRLGRDVGRAVDVLLDPIVLGVVGTAPPAHGETCLWFPLVAWRW